MLRVQCRVYEYMIKVYRFHVVDTIDNDYGVLPSQAFDCIFQFGLVCNSASINSNLLKILSNIILYQIYDIIIETKWIDLVVEKTGTINLYYCAVNI